MKKLLGLLGTILVIGNAIPSVIAAAPNRKYSIKKRQTTLTNEKNQQTNTGTSNDSQDGDSATEFIEKEITLNEDYSDNIQKMLQELIDENYIDPLRSINMGGLISKELDNETIISKLEELEPKMANWIKKRQNNKYKILILTLKNSDNKSIKLVINLNNFYLLGFINNQNQYFYFDDELLEKIKQNNQNEITELEKIKTDLEKLNKLIKEKSKDKTEKENLEWEIKEKLNKLKELDKLKEKVKLEKNPEEIKKIEKNIKNINELIKEQINKSKDFNKLNKELIEVKKAKLKEQINETNQKIEKLKKEIFIPIPSINYNNDKKYLDNKIKNLQGEGLKTEEIKTKTLNTKVTEKYNCQKINLNYTGAYSEDGLNVVLKEKDKPTRGKDIIISKDTLNNVTVNLANYNNKQNENIKNDLVRLIFVTSEAMRFQCDKKTLEIFANIKNIDELKTIISESKNILKDIQEKIFDRNQKINWKDYTSQLRGDWKKYSEQFNKFRIEIWEQLIKIKRLNNFIFTKKENLKNNEFLDEILKVKDNEQKKLTEKIENWFNENSNANEKDLKDDFVNEATNFIKIQKNQLNLEIWNTLSSNFTSEQLIIKKQQEIFQKIKQQLKNNEYSLLDQKVKTNIINAIDNFSNNDTSLLCLSINQKNLDFTKLLIIILNKNPKAINGYWAGLSSLHFAAYNGFIDIVRELLNYPNINVNILDNNGNGKSTPLNYAIIMNNIEIVKELLTNQNSKNKINVNAMTEDDLSPLHFATYFGYTEIVRELLKHHKINVNAEYKNRWTPLYIAASKGHSDIVKLFINEAKKLYGYQSEAFKNFINAKDKNGLTPLYFYSNVETVKLLIDNKADVNITNNNNNSILHLAIWNNNFKIIKELLTNQNSKDKINVNAVNNYGNTPIMGAIQNNNIEIVKLLLNNPKIDIIKTNKNGFSPLYIASQKGYEEIKNILKKFNELNKKINLCNNLLKNPQNLTEEQKIKIQKNLEETKKELKTLLQIQLSDVITQTDLGELADSSSQTILNKLRELNPNLDVSQVKVQQNSITETSATVINNENYYSGEVLVKFTIKKENLSSKKQLTPSNGDNQYSGGRHDKTNGNNNSTNQSVNTSNTGSGTSRVSVGNHAGTSTTQGQNSNQKQQNNLYDVPADNSCLFWSVATSYLLQVRSNAEEFKNRFIQLFGKENLKYLKYIQKLLKQYNLENNRNLNQLWYQDQTANNLVTNVFRNSVVDYIERNLDTISNHSGELTFRNLIQENNEIDSTYLERMRQPSTWGGLSEIIAMANILNANISVNNDAPYQPINQNSTNTINIFHVNNRTHYNFALTPEDQPNHPSAINDNQKNTPVVDTTNRPNNLQPTNTKSETKVILSNNDDDNQGNNIINPQEKMKIQLQKNEYHFLDKKTEDNSLKNDENLEINLIKNNNKINTNAPVVNKPISTNKNMENLQKTNAKTISKYNTLSKAKKQQKLNEINQHYQNLSENDKKNFKDKLKAIGTSAIGAGISAVGTKITVSGGGAASNSAVSTGEAMEMTSLLSEEGLAAAETLSVAEGTTAVIATEGSIIGAEAATASALAPETLGLSLVIGGLAIAETAIIWWLSGHDNTQAVKHESHNQYNEIEKYYKFLAHDQLKLDINITKWDKIKQIYQGNSNNYQEFKNKIKSEITNFYKEDHSGLGGSLTDDDINTLINIIYNHFQEINNHFSSNPNHGWKIVTNTIGSYFIIEEE